MVKNWHRALPAGTLGSDTMNDAGPFSHGPPAAGRIRTVSAASALALVAIAAVIVASATTTGYTGDSYTYMEGAEALRNWDGYTSNRLLLYSEPTIPTPIVTWPPVYSAAIASVTFLGLDTDLSARVVSFVAFGAAIALFFIFANRYFGFPVAMTSAVLLAISPEVLDASTRAMSEATFLLLSVGSLALLFEAHVASASKKRLLLFLGAGILLALTLFTRYWGVTLVPAFGAMFLLWWYRSQHSSIVARIQEGALLFVPSLVLLPVWLTRNYLSAGSLTGERAESIASFVENITFAAKTIGADMQWTGARLLIVPELLSINGSSRSIVFFITTLVLAGVISLFVLYSVKRNGLVPARSIVTSLSPQSHIELSLLVMLVVTGMTMILFHSIFGGLGQLSTRLLLPLYPMATVLIVLAFLRVTELFFPTHGRHFLAAIAAIGIASFTFLAPFRVESGGGFKITDETNAVIGQITTEFVPEDGIVLTNLSGFYRKYGRVSIEFHGREFPNLDFDCEAFNQLNASLDPTSVYFMFWQNSSATPDEIISHWGTPVVSLMSDLDVIALEDVSDDVSVRLYAVGENGFNCASVQSHR